MLARVLIACIVLLCSTQARAATDRLERLVDVGRTSEVQLLVLAGCQRCDWGASGREAAALTLLIDGTYSQHLILARGEGPEEYRVSLGTLLTGRHKITIERDPALSADGAGPATIEIAGVSQFEQGAGGDANDVIDSRDSRDSRDYTALSMAPILHARANTVGRFTDLPILMWYEIVPTPRGRQYRYSVVFTNEDGGTATDRLMATWGRTTDIEFVYGVELDRNNQVVAEEFQGPGHDVPAFKGRHEGRHPLLWVSTDNNMVSDSGTTRVRYAPAPERFDLTSRAREAVMDAYPWSYALMVKELTREHKIDANATPGSGSIPDPRRFVYIEACGEMGTASLSFDVAIRDTWIDSDYGLPRFRIARDGCFSAAAVLPAGAGRADMFALRVVAHGGPVHLTRINRVFLLDERSMPSASILDWTGSATIATGTPFELPIK